MKTLECIFLVLALAPVGSAQTSPSGALPNTLKVKIEAPELDRDMLLQKLTEHGKGHGLHFESASDGFEYRIVFATGQEKYPLYGGAINSSGALVRVYDAKGGELFTFNRAGRWTDKGATNAAAKEIVKRILRLRKLKEGKG
jgi:hypothetical protein